MFIMQLQFFCVIVAALVTGVKAQCADYSTYSTQIHQPVSSGKYALSWMRPNTSCRTFTSSVVESTIADLESVIKDPDLYRLFQNSYPNSLDTAVKWKGTAAGSDEELTFLITGDIANQMQSYLPLLTPDSSNNSIASLYRGVINLQARYILEAPHCNSFQPPVESNIAPSVNGASSDDTVFPSYSNTSVFECKYELDSLAAFLEISTNYYEATNDSTFFSKYSWTSAIETILNTTTALQLGTYASNGAVNQSPYTFTRLTTAGTETLANSGKGNPVQEGTGLVRSAFRPSDDACIYQLFIPANMMFARYLSSAASIASAIGNSTLSTSMTNFANSIGNAISAHGIVTDPVYGEIFAYEVDGFGSRNLMDDANIPSLLSIPFIGYAASDNPIYNATRQFILSANNPYFMRGPVINAVGGPHEGPGMAWPMASIIRILTSDDDAEITTALKEIVSSTANLGLIHESINTFNATDYTRQWFSWANGLFGQMILDLNDRKPEILAQSFQ